MGHSVPEVESAPAFFVNSYPQGYPQGVDSMVKGGQTKEDRPPIVKKQAGESVTPQTNISTKVKLQYGSEQGFYTV